MAIASSESRVVGASNGGAPSTRLHAPLLVATDATSSSDAAIRAARAIAARTGQVVALIAVHEPLPIVSPEIQLREGPDFEAEQRQLLRHQVRDQLARSGIEQDWPIEVMSGTPAATIASVAQRMGASLVIMGLGGHGVFDRILGDEMVLRVLRLGTVPVLAVAPSFTRLPMRVLAATDFTPSSVRAIALAGQIMDHRGTLTLAHVLAKDMDPANWSRKQAGFHGTIGRGLDLVVAKLGSGENLTVERKILAGDPAKSLLNLSEQIDPDLIVVGSHGRGFVTRLMLGSVSTKLLRSSQCSVLVAPPIDGPSFIDELPEATTRFASYEWAERLEEFTRRNAGRKATLEVVDPDIGAQIEEKGIPFAGAAYDSRNACLQIMVGDAATTRRHLTRNIRGVTAVQVLRDRMGKDLMLRVAHGRGQTLLTLDR